MSQQMKTEPEISEIREIRHQLSAEAGHDPKKFFDDLLRFQSSFEHRMVGAKVVITQSSQTHVE